MFHFSLDASIKEDSLITKLQKLSSENTEEKASLLFELGTEYMQNANFEKALENHFEALKLFEQLDNQPEIAQTYNQIGIVYKRNYKYELALSYFEKSFEIEKKLGNVERQGSMLGNIGVAYASLNKPEIALKYYLESKEYLMQVDGYNTATLSNNLGWLSYKLEKYNESIEYYKEAVKEANQHGDSLQLCITYNNIGLSYMELSELDSAEKYMVMSLDLCKRMNMSVGLVQTLIAYSDLLDLKNEHEKSRDYLYQYIWLNDSIFSKESDNAIQDIRVKYETEQKEQEIKLLEHKSQLDKQKTQLLILGIILVLTIGLFLLYRFITHRKRMADNLELNKLRREKLKEELGVKDQQLTNFAILTVEKNEFMTTLNKHIKSLKRESGVFENVKFKDLVASINNYALHDKNRYLFDAEMDEAYESFFIKLNNKYPELTQTEKKLAALLRLNLSSKEIASLMNVSSKSVDTYRYNLRKKLNLGQNDNLTSILLNI